MSSAKVKKFKDVFVNDEYNVGKIVAILLMISATTFILTPKHSTLDVTYLENDIAISDIVVEEDQLLEDVYATELKKESLVQNLGLYFTHLPDVNKNRAIIIRQAFNESHKKLLDIEAEYELYQEQYLMLVQDMVSFSYQTQEITDSINAHEKLKIWLEKKVAEYRRSSSPLAGAQRRQAGLNISQINAVRKYRENLLENLKQNISGQEQGLDIWKIEQEKIIVNRNAKREKVIRDFAAQFQIILSEEESKDLLDNGFSDQLGNALADLLQSYETKSIVAIDALNGAPLNSPIYVKAQGSEEDFEPINGDSLVTTEDIRQHAVNLANNISRTQTTNNIWQVGAFLAHQLVVPNLVIDKREVEDRRKNIRESSSPVYVSLKKGDIIAKRGERLDLKSVKLINQYYKKLNERSVLPLAIGIFLITVMMTGIIYLIFRKVKFLSYVMHKNMVMISLISVIHVGVNYGVYLILQSLSSQYRFFNVQETGFYAMPIALAPMLLAILTGFEASLIATIMIAILTSLISSSFTNFFGLFYVIFSGIFAAYTLGNNQSRIDLLIQGMKVSLFNVPLVSMILLFQPPAEETPFYFYLAAALISGFLSALFTMFVYPFLEAIFDITTDLKLLELSNMNHPVLKNLMVKAPGSYQHSIMVGNLAEAGALKIGANSLLCRVASYYHDIGKTNSPQYFIENLGFDEINIHDQMQDPYESSKQIILHVTEGIKIARGYRLGKAIIDIIQQHHGTSTMNYFYKKAQTDAEKAGKPATSVSRNDFKYPGPRPQSIEAAIVMLADSCEASTRSLKNPTKENIEKIIHTVGRNLLSEGQLDNSGISLKDFQSLIRTFSDMLISLYHKRVAYPHQEEASNLDNSKNKPAIVASTH